MSSKSTFHMDPYLTVEMGADNQLQFVIGKIRFNEIPSCIFHPSVHPEHKLRASDFGISAEVPIPAGRMGALYSWYDETHCRAKQ